MKKIISVIAFVLSMFIVGCDNELPTPDKINGTATTIGRTAGYACEFAKTKTAVKTGIIQVLDVISTVVPAEGQTFSQAWSSIITEELQKLVSAGKLDDTGAQVAKTALNVACDGIDYVFVRYPNAKNVKELVSATSTGFINGFKSVVTLAAGAEKPEIDEEAYKYLKSRMTR